MAISAGTRFGPYEVVAPLGAGGMGEVWRARDERLGREVAVKFLPDEVASDAGRLKRFEKEARAASALNHPNIVTIYDIGSAESRTSREESRARSRPRGSACGRSATPSPPTDPSFWATRRRVPCSARRPAAIPKDDPRLETRREGHPVDRRRKGALRLPAQRIPGQGLPPRSRDRATTSLEGDPSGGPSGRRDREVSHLSGRQRLRLLVLHRTTHLYVIDGLR
jgi:hypothetical protein